MIVVLDYGHGLPDPGACGNGLEEYKVARNIGEKVRATLERHNVRVVLTRTTEKSLSNNPDKSKNKKEDINNRVSLVNKSGASLVVSIHLNAGGGAGFETYCHSKDSKVEAVHNTIINFLKKHNIKDRGIKSTNQSQHTSIGIVDRTKPKSLLIECLFIDNINEMNLMKQDKFLTDFSESIAEGILKAVGVKYVPIPINPKPSNPVSNSSNPKIEYEGKTIEGIIKNDKSYAPVAALADLLGYQAIWDNTNRKVIIKRK